MSKLLITGDQNPEIGKEYHYRLSFIGLGSMPNNIFNPHPEITKWEIYVLENGKWRKTKGNSKQGEIVSYLFNQSSLTRKGIKICVTKGENTGELIVKPKRAGQPKINKIELLDINGNKVTKPLSYSDTLTVKAYCTDMEGETVQFTLWEDDAKGEGHDKINSINRINAFPIPGTVKKGVAKANFNMATYAMASFMANVQIAKGDKNEGKTHEYYATAEYFGKLEASNNVNLKNPAHHPNPTTNGNKSGATKPTTKQQPNQRPVPPAPAPKKDTYKTPVTPKAKTQSQDPQGKIVSAEFVNMNGKPYESMKFGTHVRAKIISKNMIGKTARLKIWEDDMSSQILFEKDYVLYADESFFTLFLTAQMREDGDDWKEGNEQEYFLEIEYAGQSVDSEVINVNDSAPKIKVAETAVSMTGVGAKKSEPIPQKGECGCNDVVTEEQLKTIFPNATSDNLKLVAKTYTKYMEDLGMNTCWNKAHLFAQARVEAGLALNMKNGENFNYYYESLSIFGAFQTKEGKEKAKLWGRPTVLPRQPGVSNENQIKIANYAYSPPAKKAKELENTEPNDGWTYRGRGLIQVTGKGFYKYCNEYTKKEGDDVIKKPDLIGEKIELAVLASMIFFKWKGINKIANGNKDVKGKICPKVGKDVIVGGKSNYDEKQRAFDEITSKIFRTHECKWGKIADAPVTTSADSVLEEMKKLVDQHIPYSQSGSRNKLDEEGLANLDCSETVGIYFHKLGIMPTYKAIDTSTMTTETNLRKTIGTNNIDFVEGSDESNFKPQRGDVFVWRKGAAGPGHTGIVYKYDEATDVVTILEAIGNVGAVSEKDQVKNGGYAQAGCSRTAKYSRLKGALYGHKGWAGYFRPKNYTRKL